jgi:hypothetical protein
MRVDLSPRKSGARFKRRLASNFGFKDSNSQALAFPRRRALRTLRRDDFFVLGA